MKRTGGLRAFVLLGILVAACGSHPAPTASSPTRENASATPSNNVKASPANYPSIGLIGPSAIGFPPRNEPNAFFQDLTAVYRDVLRRSQTSPTYVDPEGENVWLTEYFRFSLNGCSHQEAVSRTLAEITSGGTQQVCGQETPIFPPRNLPNLFQGQLENTYRDALRRPQMLSYVDSEGANVWLAEYLRYRVSGCSHTAAEGKVFTQIQNGGVQADCTPAPAPAPPPPPQPSPRFRIGAICNDGTSSTATGSGACSSHDGVRCWRYSDGSCTIP